MEPSRVGTIGWLILAAFVWLWDWLAKESLSAALWRGLANPRKRWLVVAAWGWVTSHLLLKRPAKILVWW